MRVVGHPKEFYHVARLHIPHLSAQAQESLRWLQMRDLFDPLCLQRG
jgi:hypothetical protein